MSEINDFRKGVRAFYDYLLTRAANHFHGHSEVQKQCDYDNDLIADWAEDALMTISESDYNQWLSITEQYETIRTKQAAIERLTAAIKVKDTALANVIVADRFCAETNASDEHRQAKADAHHEALLSVEDALAIKPENVELVEVGYIGTESMEVFLTMGMQISPESCDEPVDKLYTIKTKA